MGISLWEVFCVVSQRSCPALVKTHVGSRTKISVPQRKEETEIESEVEGSGSAVAFAIVTFVVLARLLAFKQCNIP